MKKSKSMVYKCGVYFLANDVVYDWTIAFLNSFRTFNPNLPLYLIPFNDRCDRILALQDNYNFGVYIDDSFSRLEAIGQSFELGYTKTSPYWFRRYAAFWGPLEQFMYLDSRQVILADLQPFIHALEQFSFDLLHYDCAIDQVYEPGELRQEILRQGRGRGFNSGRWAARRGLFSLEEFERLGEEAIKLREQLNPRNTDQAFINYCCDIKPVRYGHFAEVMGGICQDGWVHHINKIYKQNNNYFIWDYGGLDHKKRIILLHWAGYQLRASMPYFHIFYYYYCSSSTFKYLINYIIRIPIYFLQIILQILRSNRYINTCYHYLKND